MKLDKACSVTYSDKICLGIGSYISLLPVKRYFNKKSAFNLAEIMVVMLIMSIVFAAMAPMTTRRLSKEQNTVVNSIWRWVDNTQKAAYFGTGVEQKACIGDDKCTPSGKLIVASSTDLVNQIIFKNNNSSQLRLYAGKLSTRPPIEGNLLINNSNLTPDKTVAIGYGTVAEQAGNTYGKESVAIGYNAMHLAQDKSIAIGRNALSGGDTPTYGSLANNNVAIGDNALRKVTTATNNIGIGNNALQKVTSAENNIGIGNSTLPEIGSKGNNIAIGNNGLRVLGSNSYNSAEKNIAIGYDVLFFLRDGHDNIAIGHKAGYRLQYSEDQLANDWFHNNLYIGKGAGGCISHGIGNIYIGGAWGCFKGYTVYNGRVYVDGKVPSNDCGSGVITYSAYNTFAGPFAGTTHNEQGIGGWVHHPSPQPTGVDGFSRYNVGIGYRACGDVRGTNKICIGHPGPYPETANNDYANVGNFLDKKLRIYIGFPNGYTSYNGTFKSPIRDSGSDGDQDPYNGPSAVISGGESPDGNMQIALAGDVSYTSAATFSDKRLKNIGKENTDGLDKIKQLKIFNYAFKSSPKIQRVGVIAQDLQKVFPNAVTAGSDGFLTVRQEDIIFAMVNAIKELDAKVNIAINEIKTMLKQLKTDVKIVVENISSQDKALKQAQNLNKNMKLENENLKKSLLAVQKNNQKMKKRLVKLENKVK